MNWTLQEKLAALKLRLIERVRASGESARERVSDEAWLREPPLPLDPLKEFERLLHAPTPQDSPPHFHEGQGDDGERRPKP